MAAIEVYRLDARGVNVLIIVHKLSPAHERIQVTRAAAGGGDEAELNIPGAIEGGFNGDRVFIDEDAHGPVLVIHHVDGRADHRQACGAFMYPPHPHY